MPTPLRSLLFASLVCIVLLTGACDAKTVAPSVAACVSQAVIFVVVNVAAPGPWDLGDVAWGAEIAGACTEAATLLFTSLAPDDQSRKLEVFEPKTITSPFAITPFDLSNCGPSALALSLNYTIQFSAQVFLQVGGQKYLAPPDETSTDDPSLIARALIDQEHIPLGTDMTAYATFPVSVAVGKKEHVAITGQLASKLGTADIKQGDNVVVPLIAWRYATGLTFPSSSVAITTSAC